MFLSFGLVDAYRRFQEYLHTTNYWANYLASLLICLLETLHQSWIMKAGKVLRLQVHQEAHINQGERKGNKKKRLEIKKRTKYSFRKGGS